MGARSHVKLVPCVLQHGRINYFLQEGNISYKKLLLKRLRILGKLTSFHVFKTQIVCVLNTLYAVLSTLQYLSPIRLSLF